MKTTNHAVATKTAQTQNRQRPENKDNLDSREGEEQLEKGDNITHNKKEQLSSRKKAGK